MALTKDEHAAFGAHELGLGAAVTYLRRADTLVFVGDPARVCCRAHRGRIGGMPGDDIWHALLAAGLLAVVAAGCSASDPQPACRGSAPTCADLVPVPPAPPGGCCGDVGVEATCEGGEWRCPDGFVQESECHGGWLEDFCANLVDASVSP